MNGIWTGRLNGTPQYSLDLSSRLLLTTRTSAPGGCCRHLAMKSSDRQTRSDSYHAVKSVGSLRLAKPDVRIFVESSARSSVEGPSRTSFAFYGLSASRSSPFRKILQPLSDRKVAYDDGEALLGLSMAQQNNPRAQCSDVISRGCPGRRVCRFSPGCFGLNEVKNASIYRVVFSKTADRRGFPPGTRDIGKVPRHDDSELQLKANSLIVSRQHE